MRKSIIAAMALGTTLTLATPLAMAQQGPGVSGGVRPAAKSTQSAAKPAKPPPQPASTPEQRSAAELALSSDPVFDDGTFLRIKQTLLSYSDIEVRGGWPALPADAKLELGASGPMSLRCASISSSAATSMPVKKAATVTTPTSPTRSSVSNRVTGWTPPAAPMRRRSKRSMFRSATASSSSKPRSSGSKAWISSLPSATLW